MASTKGLFARLTRRGPHRVLRGDLAFAGLPGVLYTPESGLGLPGVAFAHDWLTPAGNYTRTLEHLASWGIVVGAPATETTLAPSVLNLSYDLGTTLDILTGVRLGPGQISVNPGKLGVAGHGFGGSAAVFAAAGLGGRLRAAAALFPTVSRPDATAPAAGLSTPGLILGAEEDTSSITASTLELAAAWEAATLRIVKKAAPRGLAEGRRLQSFAGLPGSDRRTQKTVCALLTGYLLFTLTGDKTYRAFADPEDDLPRTSLPSEEFVAGTPEEKFVALLKG